MEQREQRIALIKDDRVHGSHWLVREALLLLLDLAITSQPVQADQMHLLYSTAQQLAQARPAMAALSSAVSRIMSVQGGPAAVALDARQALVDLDSASARLTEHAQAFLHGHLLTCSISGTVLDVLVALRQQIEHVTVLEGRPHYEGRETARILSEQGLPVTLLTDAQAAIFIPQCHSVVVGADSVLENGDVLNKAGTALLAWTAHGYTIPFYVLCETLKISPHRWDKYNPAHLTILEEHEPSEVLEQAIPGVIVRNFYFDHTPAHLITKLITEQGILEQPAIHAIAAETQRNESLLMQKHE